MRTAVSVPRMEIRRDGPVRRYAQRTGAFRVREESEAQVVSAGRTRRRALDLHGTARTPAAAAGIRICDRAASPDLYVEAVPGVQLVAGDGRRHRFEPRV